MQVQLCEFTCEIFWFETTLNYWTTVERYPKLEKEVGNSIPSYEMSSLLDENLLGGQLPIVLWRWLVGLLSQKNKIKKMQTQVHSYMQTWRCNQMQTSKVRTHIHSDTNSRCELRFELTLQSKYELDSIWFCSSSHSCGSKCPSVALHLQINVSIVGDLNQHLYQIFNWCTPSYSCIPII